VGFATQADRDLKREEHFVGISMKMRGTRTGDLVAILVLAGASSVAWTAQAQPVAGLYIGADLGLDLHAQEAVKNLSIGSDPLGGLSTDGNAKFRPGFAGLASLGFRFGNGLRIEGEDDFLTDESKGFSGGTRVAIAGCGKEQKYGFMGTALYAFVDVPMDQPYIGAGVGVQWVNWQIAFQAISGVAIPIPAAPGLAITVEYRFMGTAGNCSTSAVKAELIKDGVPTVAIATQGFGETDLLVPTGVGVREPQNRRVKIVLHSEGGFNDSGNA
jgi:hypothetical protein